MAPTTLSRRTLLQGMLGGSAVGVALPVFQAMLNANGTAFANGAALPKRFGIFFWGNGVDLARWTPDDEGTGWVPKEALQPLAGVKEYVTVLSGMVLPVRSGTAHHHGRAQILTGSDELTSEYGPPSHPSIDQIIASEWTGRTSFPSLELGVSKRGFSNEEARGAVAVTAEGLYLPQETSPSRLFDRVFGGSPASEGTQEWKVARARISILDAVKADAGRLSSRLGRVDQKRLEQHLDGIRDIERRLKPNPATSSCSPRPARPAERDDMFGHEDLEGVNRAMADMLAIVLSCDLTRVFSYAYTQLLSDTIFWQVGLKDGLHFLSHDADVSVEACHKAATFTMGGLAYLLEKLRGTPEGAGNLLDSLCMMATSEVSTGLSHSTDDLPILVIGAGGGALRPGIHYRSKSGESTNRLLLTLLNVMGIPRTEFGSAKTRTSDTFPPVLA